MNFAAIVKQSSSMVGVRIVRKEKRFLTALNIQFHHFVSINEE
jgi:phage-related protein